MRLFRRESVALPTEDAKHDYIVRFMPLFTDRVCINILRGEIPILHSHPWNFVSIILWGGYRETRMVDGVEVVKDYGPGSVIYRRFDEYHRIVPLGDKCITLFFRSAEKTKSTIYLIDGKPMLDMKYWVKHGCSRDMVAKCFGGMESK